MSPPKYQVNFIQARLDGVKDMQSYYCNNNEVIFLPLIAKIINNCTYIRKMNEDSTTSIFLLFCEDINNKSNPIIDKYGRTFSNVQKQNFLFEV